MASRREPGESISVRTREIHENDKPLEGTAKEEQGRRETASWASM